MAKLTLQEAEETFQVQAWGDGYFSIGDNGNLQVKPTGPKGGSIDIAKAIAQLREEGIRTPVTLRFPQILHDKVDRLNRAFLKALQENGCKGVNYRGVFPIKVNQQKEVVRALTTAGRKWAYGLEVGSKAELLAAITMDPNRKSLLVVNGFKDRAFLEAACRAALLKEEVIIVLDEVGELDHLIPMLDRLEHKPLLGIRLKLRSKAPGKWALSGGERAKFGLTTPELIYAFNRLKETGHLEQLAMVHFHIGSQISDIRRITQGVREASRIHTELVRMGANLRYIDVGGGMAVDYDGSGSSGPNSANYSMEEYASSIVATLKDICDEAGVPMPNIINESGRAVVAHHALLVVDVVRRVPHLEPVVDDGPRDDDSTPLWNMYETYQHLGRKNVYESFHDALQHREDLQSLFDLGHLSLESLGRTEAVFRAIVAKVRDLLRIEEETESEEYIQASQVQSQKLVCNFSLFQSLPDVWGVKQQFPIVPIHRLLEAPAENATIADITCDSDGEIRRFIDHEGTRNALPVHALRKGQPYMLAMALVGAYQDTLGDYHNLLGETNEAWLETDGESWNIVRKSKGSRVADMLEWVRYDPADLKRRLRGRIQRMYEKGLVDSDGKADLESHFIGLLQSSTYLEGDF